MCYDNNLLVGNWWIDPKDQGKDDERTDEESAELDGAMIQVILVVFVGIVISKDKFRDWNNPDQTTPRARKENNIIDYNIMFFGGRLHF